MNITIQPFGILIDVLDSWGSWTHNDDYIPHVLGVCAQFDESDIFGKKMVMFPFYKA
jgi:hypothetical protein